jgi:hypothetical protein
MYVENNPMHSSGDFESIGHFRSVPGRRFSDLSNANGSPIPTARMPHRAARDLTRRAKHWQSGIIGKFENPRGEIRRGFFHVGEVALTNRALLRARDVSPARRRACGSRRSDRADVPFAQP